MVEANRLIVALDAYPREAIDTLRLLLGETPVRFFKLRRGNFLRYGGWHLAVTVAAVADLMIDLKDYDPRDSVDDSVRAAFDLGARFVTVHATPSIMETAMRAKPQGEKYRVLAVGHLTDNPATFSSSEMRFALEVCDGIVCSAREARFFRESDWGRQFRDKTLVCPGIRSGGDGSPEYFSSHAVSSVASPSEAVRAGANYLVVGRPIWQAADPVAEASAILEEIASA